mgnify:CR=1 FL=1
MYAFTASTFAGEICLPTKNPTKDNYKTSLEHCVERFRKFNGNAQKIIAEQNRYIAALEAQKIDEKFKKEERNQRNDIIKMQRAHILEARKLLLRKFHKCFQFVVPYWQIKADIGGAILEMEMLSI